MQLIFDPVQPSELCVSGLGRSNGFFGLHVVRPALTELVCALLRGEHGGLSVYTKEDVFERPHTFTYVVGLGQHQTVKLPLETVKLPLEDGDPEKLVSLLITKLISSLGADGVGLWIDDNIIYVDGFDCHRTRDTALWVGDQRSELSIYDRVTQECIDVTPVRERLAAIQRLAKAGCGGDA
jgi:hypothetical protein